MRDGGDHPRYCHGPEQSFRPVWLARYCTASGSPRPRGPSAGFRPRPCANLLLRPVQHLREALVVHRLEHVVHGPHVERPDRVLLVRSHEYHDWHAVDADAPHDFQAIELRM